MLPERFEIPAETWDELQRARAEGRRIFAVGTTVTRALESVSPDGPPPEGPRETNLFITPGFEFRWVRGLVTNFHVPRSTPVSLTAAFLGLARLERAYREAIRRNYRFFSYGDAMLIL